jgi:hypothetical protein
VAETRIIYLDLNHWYALGRAMAGRPDDAAHVGILHALTEGVEQGRLTFPLSGVHYMELAENPRDNQREEAARVMALLSRFKTITSLKNIIDEELACALNQRFGRPGFPVKVKKFGTGINFALTGEEKVGIDQFSSSEDIRSIAEEKFGTSNNQFLAALDTLTEYELLRQPPVIIRGQIPGYDPYAARAIADQELASFNVMVDTVHTDEDIKTRPLDAICARQFLFEFRDNLVRALMSAGFVKRYPFNSREELTGFLMSMPSRRVATMLQYHYLKDLQKRWKINDLRDNAALSKAIPYCDIVVTDKEVWNVAVNLAHLDREFGKVILRRLIDLSEHLS